MLSLGERDTVDGRDGRRVFASWRVVRDRGRFVFSVQGVVAISMAFDMFYEGCGGWENCYGGSRDRRDGLVGLFW